MAKIIVGMSGGVDSAVTAYLLKAAGHDVIGVTLKTWVASDGKESRCCEIDDAQIVADMLQIPYYAQNCLNEFRECVTEPFSREYLNGRTPNPCIECNRYIKWDRLLYMAKVMNADYVATGHYAGVVRLANGRYTVKKALHAGKDQTYMLYKLTQEQLKHTLMPLGNLTKDEVRSIAEKARLPVSKKPDSQEICFVPDGRYTDFLKENYPDEIPPEGYFVDESGKVLGKHKGISEYTVGQRKGLGISASHPLYVTRIDAGDNRIVLAGEESLYKREIVCKDVNFMGIGEIGPDEELHCEVKVRYHHAGSRAIVKGLSDGNVDIVFDEKIKAPTPGQSAVFYDESGCVLGGGIIDATY
ncbi:MAG: tRNA 2-thiouridine(34) synthase MnmA [Lachnospiraceae bacterium]|nr:tRNA 2-thiouridine(34) synthase MnmA [Lachnospiraceae bacterium]